MRHSIFIKIQAVPLLKQIEERDCKCDSHLEICPDSLPQMLEFTDLREQRKDGFDQHPVVPLAAPTNFQVLRRLDFAPKTDVRQDDHCVSHLFDQAEKFLIRHIRRADLPISHESELVCQQTKFFADNPLLGSEAFFADAPPVRLMVLPDRMAQFDAVRINHAKQRRFCQKPVGQSTMGFQAAKKASAFWQVWKQSRPVLFNPTVEGVLRNAFERKQQAKRD